MRVIKTFLLSVLLLILFSLASISNILEILAHRVTFYVALVLLIGALIAAVVILSPLGNKGKKNEEDDK